MTTAAVIIGAALIGGPTGWLASRLASTIHKRRRW